MSSRRVPLSTSNPNVAHSPMRAASAAANGTKKVRSHADVMREEPYGQPPPAKRQMVDRGVASPSRSKPARTAAERSPSKAIAHRSVSKTTRLDETDLDYLRTWHAQIRTRFPNMVFYFESIPDEQRSRLARQVGRLGAREEKFFSINISHVVTSRPIPPEKPKSERERERETVDEVAEAEQPKTIDPSLLNRPADPTRRKLVFDKKPPVPRTRSTDVLDRARDMGKKIWSLEKLQKILDIALQPDPYAISTLAHGRGSTQTTNRAPKDQHELARMLHNERVHGPSDRDPTVSSTEMYMFKGPYIMIYDVEEKHKPIMIREYPKKPKCKGGDWPQFRVVSDGRCPFVIDDSYDAEKERRARSRERARTKARAAKAAEKAAEPAAAPQKAADITPSAVTGKRTLTQMEDGHNRGAAVRVAESFDRSRVSNPPSLDFRQNAFISHAKERGRFLAGEPVASGLQPSNVTSAIRSQMVSSTTGGVLGAKAGTSKEIHGLQRKVVLQKASAPVPSQDPSSRRTAEASRDGQALVRSASASQATQRRLDKVDEEPAPRQREKLRRTASVPAPQPKKRDPKPGYCENCQDKFDDFDEHIVSRKHRKFAENDDNWAELDALLAQLQRVPRFSHYD